MMIKGKNRSVQNEELQINKNLMERNNDWWVESGGPPVTNEGQSSFEKVMWRTSLS